MRIALITGASSGMGAEFARQIDRTEKNIDAIWLTARRKERLEKTAAKLKHPSRIFPLDLTKTESCTVLRDALREENAEVGLFVNCAGYGKIGNYAAVSEKDSIGMIDLNCSAAVRTTLTCLPFMRAGDRIIQICSTAAFQPLQHINIYGATKTFLYHYSRALRMELLPRKISVLAVCPFWVRDTEFIGIADRRAGDAGDRKKRKEADSSGGTAQADPAAQPDAAEGAGDEEAAIQPDAAGKYGAAQMEAGSSAAAMKNAPAAGRPIRHFYFATTAEHVVRSALRGSRRGNAVCTPGLFCTADRIFAKLLPREITMYIWELFRRL